jgi:hypothetical protein
MPAETKIKHARRFSTVVDNRPSTADSATEPEPNAPTVYWLDKFALKIWIAALLLMAMMNIYDFVSGLFR